MMVVVVVSGDVVGGGVVVGGVVLCVDVGVADDGADGVVVG